MMDIFTIKQWLFLLIVEHALVLAYVLKLTMNVRILLNDNAAIAKLLITGKQK